MKLNPDRDNDTYDAQTVEEYVTEAVLSFAVKDSDEIREKSVSADNVALQLTAEYEKLDGQYRRAVKAYTVLGDEEMLKKAQEISNGMKRLGREIEAAKEKNQLSASIVERINLLRTLPDTWKEMTAKQKQNVMRDLVQNVVITSGRVDVYLYKNKYSDLT